MGVLISMRCSITTALLIVFAMGGADAYLSVNGTALQRCSGTGMALTGFTRNGHCVDQNDDAGSHHICIDMSSNTGGNFCSVTGQPNWCGTQMPCDGNSGAQCQVKNWCVCQWAFASYIQRAGGCDKIQNIVCDATNQQAHIAYKAKAATDASVKAALACLEKRCKLSSSMDQLDNATSSAR